MWGTRSYLFELFRIPPFAKSAKDGAPEYSLSNFPTPESFENELEVLAVGGQLQIHGVQRLVLVVVAAKAGCEGN